MGFNNLPSLPASSFLLCRSLFLRPQACDAASAAVVVVSEAIVSRATSSIMDPVVWGAMEDHHSGGMPASGRSSLPMLGLLRGTPLSVVLRRGGRIFENNQGTAESYELSSQVDHLDTFVSHTWRTPRRWKFLALSLHFGFAVAYAFSLLTGVVVSTLGAMRLLSFLGLESFQGLTRVPNGPYGLLFCPLTFWLVLVFRNDLVQPLHLREHQVFLDKACEQSSGTVRQAWLRRLRQYFDADNRQSGFFVRCRGGDATQRQTRYFGLLGLCHAQGPVLEIARSLDKVCIHQTDTSLKKEGVAHLGLFLFFSGQLVVLETDDYLERLWTVYELATYLLLHPQGRLVMLPVNLPPTVLLFSIVLTTCELISFVHRSTIVNEYLPFAASLGVWLAVLFHLPVFFIYVILLRRWAVEQQRRTAQLLHHFSIASAECANEDDRGPVMANITAMLNRMHTEDHDVEDAGHTFDNLVRQAVPQAVQNSVGCLGVPYTHLLILSLSVLGEGFDAVGSEIAAGSTLSEAFPRCWIWFAVHFGGYPLCVAVASLLTRRCLHLHGFLVNVYLGVVWIIVVLVVFGIQSVLTTFRELAVNNFVISILFVAVFSVMALLAFLTLQPRVTSRRNLYTTADDESLKVGQPILSADQRFSRDCSSASSSEPPRTSRSSSDSLFVNVTAATLGRIGEVEAQSTLQPRRVVRMSL